MVLLLKDNVSVAGSGVSIRNEVTLLCCEPVWRALVTGLSGKYSGPSLRMILASDDREMNTEKMLKMSYVIVKMEEFLRNNAFETNRTFYTELLLLRSFSRRYEYGWMRKYVIPIAIQTIQFKNNQPYE